MESIALEGIAALDGVKAEGAPSSAVGEGLADALNVGGLFAARSVWTSTTWTPPAIRAAVTATPSGLVVDRLEDGQTVSDGEAP